MKLYRIPAAGKIDALQLVDVPTPIPGPYQVVVRVHATCLNYRDLSVILGRYGRGGLPENLVPLSDGVGEVVAIGAGVRRVAVGDRVGILVDDNCSPDVAGKILAIDESTFAWVLRDDGMYATVDVGDLRRIL